MFGSAANRPHCESISNELGLAPLPMDHLSKSLSHELCLAPLPMDCLSAANSPELGLAPLPMDRLSKSVSQGLCTRLLSVFNSAANRLLYKIIGSRDLAQVDSKSKA